MINFPFKKPKPDFEDFIKVCEGKKIPDRVHNIEVLFDEEIKKEILEKYLNLKFYHPVGMFYGKIDKSVTTLNYKEHKKAKEDYYRMNTNFHYMMGYSIVTDHDYLINLESFNSVARRGKDTAILTRGERYWAQEGFGLIRSWDDYENFQWNKAEDLLDEHYQHLKFMSINLPDGMKIAVVGAVIAQLLGWIFGFEGLFLLTYDNPDLVKAVIDKMGSLIFKMYEIALQFDSVGIIWHGDDLGFKTSTMLSREILRQLVFPWYKKYSDLAHSFNKKFWVHCCGYKDSIMDDFINDIKIDGLHSFQDNCCSVIEYKKRYGDKIAILGGVDVDKLSRLDEIELRKYIKSILKECLAGGRFILGSGNSITNFVPVKNYLIMIDEGNKWFA